MRIVKRILVVDDEDNLRGLVQKVLTREGFEVVLAENGRAGLEAVKGHEFALVLTDVFMPDIDGIEFVRKLKKIAPGVPYVVMSGGGTFNNMSMLELAEHLGATATLEKPFRLEELIAIVRSAVGD